MLNRLVKLLTNFPMKSIFITIVVVIVFTFGVRNVYMATGNDTLVKADTDVYEDNEMLEKEFGGESVIVLYESNDVLTLEHLKHMKGIEDSPQTNDSIYSMMSPVTLVEEIARKQSDEFQDGIKEIIDGLDEMGTELIEIGEELMSSATSDPDMTLPEIGGLYLPKSEEHELPEMGNLEVSTMEGAEVPEMSALELPDFDTMKQLEEANQKLLSLSKKMAQMDNMSGEIPQIPANTAQALENIQINLTNQLAEQKQMQEEIQMKQMKEKQQEQASMLKELGDGLTTMGSNVQDISENMRTIEEYSDIMAPGIPDEQDSLDNMLYDDGELRTMFKEVVVDDNHMIMIVKFNGDTDDEEKSNVVDTIQKYLDDEQTDSLEIIVSGKPVLDNGIRSSMQESIQKMMGLALLLMVIVLFFVFKVRWFLLPLLTVLIAVIGTVGLMGWVQIPITMVSMAVFPILIGLGIDYAIQFQNRYAEEMAEEDVHE